MFLFIATTKTFCALAEIYVLLHAFMLHAFVMLCLSLFKLNPIATVGSISGRAQVT